MYYDPETIETLRKALDEAWALLSLEQRARTSRVIMAERMLRAAERGERDMSRLRTAAVVGLVSSDSPGSQASLQPASRA